MPERQSFSTLPSCTCHRRARHRKQRSNTGCWYPVPIPLCTDAWNRRLQPTALLKGSYSAVVAVFVTEENTKPRGWLSHLGFQWWECLHWCSPTVQSPVKAKLRPVPSPNHVFHLSIYKMSEFCIWPLPYVVPWSVFLRTLWSCLQSFYRRSCFLSWLLRWEESLPCSLKEEIILKTRLNTREF